MPTVTGPRPPPSIVVTPDAIASSHRPAESKWTWTSMRAGGRNHALGRTHVGVGAHNHVLVDAVHGLRVTRLADPGDAAIFDADVALDDPEHRIDQHYVGDDEIERSVRQP